MLTKHQSVAAEFIQLLSAYPAFIANGTEAEGGGNLREELDDQLHEFAAAMGVSGEIEWHNPKNGRTDQIAVHQQALAYIVQGANRIIAGLNAHGDSIKAMQGDRHE